MVPQVNLIRTPLDGVMVARTKRIEDERGTFQRFFCDVDLHEVVGERKVVQINHSKTRQVGTVRGMHFQYPPHAETKFVRCLRGRVWDVVVDLRKGSPTFQRWHAEILSQENAHLLVIPEGCAHGFQVLEADSELLYLHSAHYEPSSEGGIRHDDPLIAIKWPLVVEQVSERDQSYPYLTSDFHGISL